MNAAIRTTKTGKVPALAPQGGASPRISQKIRLAIDAIATLGLSQREAARRAGLHEVSLSKALAKPHVKAALDERKAQAAMEADRLKGIARSIAIEEGIRLMTQAQSEAVRAKMVEFFAGEPRGAGVVVQVNNPAPVGYAYRRPDSASEAIDGQAVEIKGPTKPVD